MKPRQLLLLAALALALVACIALDLGRFFSLAYLQSAQTDLAALVAQHPAQAMAAFFALYVLATGLSIPAAGTVLTLAAGALFGLWLGVLIVSFASTLGATLAMLSARYLLRDMVAARFGRRMADIDSGIAQGGSFYLVTLRLVPLFPYFVVNLLMGLTAMPVRTYWVASQLGMLAGTVVYVQAGTQLARIESLRDIASPGLLGSFVLLGLFPLLARQALARWQARRVYARWAGRKPKRFDRNMVVIGAGAAGLVTSYIAAAVKASVSLVESHHMGGDCLNTGCVPSKTLIHTARLAHAMRHSGALGIAHAGIDIDFAAVMERVAATVQQIAPNDSIARYTALGVDVQTGHAHIVDPWHVQITRPDGSVAVLSTRSIVIATGAAPVVPPLPGLRETGFVTSETLWELRSLPKRLVVLGGGPIGCELAQAFARLGSQVTQIEAGPRLLSREDDEVAACVQQALQADGVDVRTGHTALRCEQEGEHKFIVIDSEGRAERIAFDTLLCAVGRAARLEGFGLEALGIPAGRTLPTNAWLQTPIPNILAAGDVAGPYQFTHAAAHQAWYAAVNGLFGSVKKFKVDDSLIPAVTFVDPEVARVGLNEREALAGQIPFEVTRYALHELDRAVTDSATTGWVKVLTVPGRDRILGVTIVGAQAGELLAEYVLAMKHGLGLNKILGTIHAYPTMAEANKAAAGAWKRAHQPERLLRWVQRWHAWRRG